MPLRPLLVASFLLLAAPAARAAIFTVGQGGACTHLSLYAAIQAAALNLGPDEIRATIAASEISSSNFVIQNQTLALRGGFADCAAAAPSGRTQLSGRDGALSPVLSLLATGGNAMDIALEGFDLVEGDNTASSFPGGGLRIDGRGSVRIEHCRIANNVARQGAGIGINGAGLDLTTVTVGDGVQIEDNRTSALGDGGGLYAAKAAVVLGGVETVVRRNEALYAGGGIYLGSGNPGEIVRLDLQSGGLGADGVLSGNRSTHFGGGLYLLSDAEARLYTTDPQRPLRLDRNLTQHGGAIAAYGSGARVDIWDAQFDANEATGGGTFYIFGPATLNLGTARLPGAPAGARPCAANQLCNRIVASRASGGAVLMASLDSQPGLVARLQATTISASAGVALFADECDANTCTLPASVQLRDVLIVANPGASRVAQMRSGVGFECDLCTLTDTGPGPEPAAPLFDSNGPLTLTRSVIHEPGRDLIGGATPQPLQAAHLLVHDAADFAGNATVRSGDPLFENPGSGNYRLGAASPALDAAPVAADAGFAWTTPGLDLDGQPRVFDDPALPNLAGPVDLGAYERPDPNFVFADGFE